MIEIAVAIIAIVVAFLFGSRYGGGKVKRKQREQNIETEGKIKDALRDADSDSDWRASLRNKRK